MKLSMVIATFNWSGWSDCVKTWIETSTGPFSRYTLAGGDILDSYQMGFDLCFDADVIGYVHDDVEIYEHGWNERVLREFDDPKVGLVGFGGAPGHGHPQMYEAPYSASSLGRIGFMSNMREAEVHGRRFDGECDVSVLDGFAMFVRREVLEKAGGWPKSTPVGYFCYDYWLCCMARRLGYRIRYVGVDCQHLGGKSTGLNPNLKADYEAAHRYIYDEFKDVLPAEVK